MSSVLLRVYFMDGGHKTVYVDPETMTIEALWYLVSQKLNLPDVAAECFFIWQISSDLELLLFADQTIQEAYDDWPRNIGAYTARPTLMRAMTTRTLNRAPSSLGLQKPASVKDNLKSSIGMTSPKGSPALARKQSLASMNVLTLSDPVAGNLRDAEVDDFKLVFRPTVVLPVYVERTLAQPEVIDLLYSQSVHHVIVSNYPCLEETAMTLAGVQIQVQLGDQKPDHRQYIHDSVEEFVPQHLFDRRKKEEWTSDLMIAHASHKGRDAFTLKKLYVNTVQEWPFYGSTFFRVKALQQDGKQSFFKQELEGTTIFGINHIGVHTIHPRALKFETWHYKSLVLWDSCNPAIFVFTVMTGSKNEPKRTYTLKTPQSELINDVMQDWAEEWEREYKVAAPVKKNDKRKSLRVSSSSR